MTDRELMEMVLYVLSQAEPQNSDQVYEQATAIAALQKRLAQPKQEPAAFDAYGFRSWVATNLPDNTIIGSSAWWADHLTAWAQRFVKTAEPLAQAPLTNE